MADHGKPRPVSGEIMTGPAAAGGSAPERGGTDIVEAEFEVVAPTVSDRESMHAGTPVPPVAPPVAGLDILRGSAHPAKQPAARGGPVFWAVGLGLVAAAFWVSGGHALMRQTALFQEEPAAALAIDDVSSRVEGTGERGMLLVDGTVANRGDGALPLPALEIRVSGNDGKVTTYKLGTGDRQLAPGERFAFSSRLEVPKNGVRDVDVRFAE